MEKGESKSALIGATTLKTDKKKETQEGENLSLCNPSHSEDLLMWNPERKVKVPLRRKATEIEDVLIWSLSLRTIHRV